MQINRQNLTNFLLVFMIAVAVSSLFLGMTDAVNRVCIILEFGILVILGLLNRTFNDITNIVVLLLNLASILMTFLNHNGFGVFLIFFNLMMACMIFNNIAVSKKTYLVLHLIPAVMLSIIALGISKDSSVMVTTRWGDTEEHFQFLNAALHPNTWGQIALAAAFNWICIIECLDWKKEVKFFSVVAVAVIFGNVILTTESRAVIFAGIAFIALYLFKRKPFEYRAYYWIVVMLLIAGWVFTLVYLDMAEQFISITPLGKSGANRIPVWTGAYELINMYPLFGSGTDMPMALWDSAHNLILHIVKNIGLIPVITFVVFMVKRRYGNADRQCSICSQRIICSSLVIAFFEAYLVDSVIYILFLIFLIDYKAVKAEGEIS